MAKFEIELDDKGDIVGTPATEVAELHKRLGIMAHGNGFQAGSAKATDDAKKQLEAAVLAERARLEATMPAEREKWQGVEADNTNLRKQINDLVRENSKTLTSREESHAEEITKRAAAIAKRDEKIQKLVASYVRGLAGTYGARDESLSELEFFITQKHIGFDDDMEAFVKDEAGNPAKTATGNAISIETFVKQYMDGHPGHRKANAAKGGDARRGATFSSLTNPTGSTLEVARARIEGGDRSVNAINDMFEASRKRAS